MWNKIVVNLVIAFIVRQVVKFGTSTDWSKVKADFDVRLRQLVPGTWFDDEAVCVANAVIDGAAAALSSPAELELVIRKAAAEDWAGAALALKALLARAVDGAHGIGKKLAYALAA